MADNSRHRIALVTVSALAGLVILGVVIYIMARGLGLQDNLDFGAGAYFYADIPEFDKYLQWDVYKTKIPYWIYVLLFSIWGLLMYFVWKWIDKKQ